MIETPFNAPGGMTPVERVSRALAYEDVDRIPFEAAHFFSDEFLRAWAQDKGVPKATKKDLDAWYGTDVAEVAADHSPWPTRAKTLESTSDYFVEVDGFGQTRKFVRGMPFWQPIAFALTEKSQLDALPFDPPTLEARYEGLVREVAEVRDRMWTRIKVGGPYSRSKWMRGELQFLMDLVEDPPFVRDLVGRVTDLVIAVGLESIRRAALPPTGIHIHDDMASLRGMIFSPRIFEAFFFEPYARMCAAFHRAGVRVFYGGEGNVREVFGMLLEAGIDGFLCMELRAGMDMVALREQYGDDVIFFGNLCNTVTLPSGDRDRIRAEVARQMTAARRGGCVVGPSHLIGGDVSVESYEWMVEAIRET